VGQPTIVNVLIPCRNEEEHIASLLDAVAEQDFPVARVVVVDDASTDGSMRIVNEWVSRHPEIAVSIVQGSGRGPAAALNAGIRESTGDTIVRLDGHCRPRPDYIRHSVELLASPGAGVTGGVWETEAGADTRVAHAIAAVMSHSIGSGGSAYRHPERYSGGGPVHVDTVPFGCFRRVLWERLGGFDEWLTVNQDYDFNYRVRQSGQRVLLDARIRSRYIPRTTLNALARQYFWYGYWKIHMLRKSPSALRWRQIPPMLLLPWLVATFLLWLGTRNTLALAAVAAYPTVVLLASADIARLSRRPSLFAAACAAIVVQHCSWSVGCWWAVVRPTHN
jgi:succinoglycan biosynthesis protein ExoA